MEHSENYYQELGRKWADGTITPEEAREYVEWYNEEDELPLIIPKEFANSEEELEQRMFASIQTGLKQPTPVVSIRRRIVRITAVAATIIAVAIGSWIIFFNDKPVEKSYPAAKVEDPGFKNDVLPGGNSATLTLANGKQIELDSAAMGTLAQQGNTTIVGKSGQLIYDGNTSEMLYNTLTTQKGQQYSLTLSDGTKVWLDAASSIRFPVSFTGDARIVEITGEAYFEVAHLERQRAVSFIVKKGDMQVEVLGTHFNVNAYDDEEDIKVTLLEGSVRVSNKEGTATIKPGQQATIAPNSKPYTSGNINLEQVMAWKNGLFDFKDADIETVLKQVVRWYNIEVKYEGEKTKDRFNGGISRQATLTELLYILKASRVKFKLEGNTLTVLP